MIDKTYRLNQVDQVKLVSLALRYKGIRTHIDEDKGILYVFTTSETNPEPTCFSLSFRMELVGEAHPGLRPDEHRKRRGLEPEVGPRKFSWWRKPPVPEPDRV